MKTKQTWEFLGARPTEGFSAERSAYAYRWISHPYTITGSIKVDGAPIFHIYKWNGKGHGKYELIEYGWSTLIRAKGFVDRYHAGSVPAVDDVT